MGGSNGGLLNCWEIKECGRDDPNGRNPCPVVLSHNSHGTNHGKNAGRYCWRIAGTYCNEECQGLFADKVEDCSRCDVFSRILREEGASFQL